VSGRFQVIPGAVGVVTWPELAALPESEIFFEQAKSGRKMSVRQFLLSKPHALPGVSPTGVGKIFQARPAIRNGIVRFTTKAYIQNSGNS
jgi:hypothetical protein